MSKRFGGKYSPGGGQIGMNTPRSAFGRAKADPVGARANLMFLPAILMVFLALNDGAVGLMLALISAAVLTLGAWLLREGLRAEAAWSDRKIARRPAFPRKCAAALLAGIGITLAAFRVAPGVIDSVLFGIATLGLHLAAFGMDPMQDKRIEGADSFQQDRVARVVNEAEAHIKSMAKAIKHAGDHETQRKFAHFQSVVRDLIRTVEEDPRDLSAARKYLGIYLLGARDATVKFVDIYGRDRDGQSRADYITLLDELSTGFAQKTKKLLTDDHNDLNVEIEVLRERLRREGVRVALTDE